jgi:ubiquinone/menaquinone biosynthesis C-methylase UbiE
MFERFARRSHKLERLDTGDYTPEEYAKWLEEAKLINRWLGDARALRLTLAEEGWLGEAEYISILDVGAGSGELLKSAKEYLGRKRMFLVGAEMSFDAARSIAARADEFGVTAVQCNGLSLPFADEAFDVVTCSLLLHHLDDDAARQLVAEMHRVARKISVVIDLRRDPLPYYLYRTFSPLFLQRMTVEDGLLSILRSFRADELRQLAEEACLLDAIVSRAAFRLILSCAKQAV